MSDNNRVPSIGVYEYLDYDDLAAIFRPYDRRSPAVATEVAVLIERQMSDARVEHVGSSAIPGCAGKGIIDLLVMYPAGRLAAARDALDSLGFQRQVGADPFPEERPLRVGAYAYDGQTFRLHVHVIAETDPEARELLDFRDHLRDHPDLVDQYVASKREAVASLRKKRNEVPPNIAYNAGKQPTIRRILAGLAREQVSKQTGSESESNERMG